MKTTVLPPVTRAGPDARQPRPIRSRRNISSDWKSARRPFPVTGIFRPAAAALAMAGMIAIDARAETNAQADVEIEARVWRADNGQDAAWMIGPELLARLPGSWVARGRFETGRFNAGGDVEETQALRLTAGWRRGVFEGGAGFQQFAFDTTLQPGWEWSYDTEGDERNADIYGPLVYGRADGGFGSLPIGWHVAAAWMVKDFGGLDDLGYDGSHADIEASISFDQPRYSLAAGWRLVAFRDMPTRDINGEKFDRDTLDGAFASLTFRF